MSKITYSLIGLGALAAIFTGAVDHWPTAMAQPTTQLTPNVESLVGKPAPEIALKTYDGKTVMLSSLKGKVVLLDFWASWCPPCIAALPRLDKLAADKALADKGLVVWAVNMGDDAADIKPFVDKFGLKLPIPMDSENKVLYAYQVQGLPSRAVIGRDGVIKFAVEAFRLGEDTEQKVTEAIDKELAAN